MSRLVELTAGKFAHASGALWLPACRVAIVADAHLGYAWAQRRRGQLGPLTDGGLRDKLLALVDELQPETLVLLGDLVHAPKPSLKERFLVDETLLALESKVALRLVRGNHDRGFARDFAHLNLLPLEQWECAELIAVHGDRELPDTSQWLAMGHHHPALAIRDAAGVTQRVPAFLVAGRRIVLPAFSPFAAGADVNRSMPAALRAALGTDDVFGVAATGRRAIAVGDVNALRSA